MTLMTDTRPTWRTIRQLTGVAALLLLSGCSDGEPMGAVSGNVTLEGRPVTAGQISFISAAGFSAVADIGSDGSFSLVERMPVDTYTVTVNPPALTDAPTGAEGAKIAVPKSAVPAGYYDEGTTDLSQEITEGKNTLAVELKTSGPAGAKGRR